MEDRINLAKIPSKAMGAWGHPIWADKRFDWPSDSLRASLDSFGADVMGEVSDLELIYSMISEWHMLPDNGNHLYSYLKMSRSEYAEWTWSRRVPRGWRERLSA